MQLDSIPSRRKHIYFFALLIVGTLTLATLKSHLSTALDSKTPTRKQHVNNLANALFR